MAYNGHFMPVSRVRQECENLLDHCIPAIGPNAPGVDIVFNFNTAIQVDDDGSRPDALLRDRKAIAMAYAAWAEPSFPFAVYNVVIRLLRHDKIERIKNCPPLQPHTHICTYLNCNL